MKEVTFDEVNQYYIDKILGGDQENGTYLESFMLSALMQTNAQHYTETSMKIITLGMVYAIENDIDNPVTTEPSSMLDQSDAEKTAKLYESLEQTSADVVAKMLNMMYHMHINEIQKHIRILIVLLFDAGRHFWLKEDSAEDSNTSEPQSHEEESPTMDSALEDEIFNILNNNDNN